MIPAVTLNLFQGPCIQATDVAVSYGSSITFRTTP